MSKFNFSIDKDLLIKLRRDFHNFPEIAFEETNTSKKIASYLKSWGIPFETNWGKTGIVATVTGNKLGKTVLYRADIDGLNIKEQTGLKFASQNGNMHACGHDSHIAISLEVARNLNNHLNELCGKVVFVFQPAEEIVSGAKLMIEEGLLEKYPADTSICLHIWNGLDTGKVILNNTIVFGTTTSFEIEVLGVGGHGSMPNKTKDPIVAASTIVNSASTILSRETSAQKMGVLTFGAIRGGTTSNAIPDKVIIQGTIRAENDELKKEMFNSLSRIAQHTAIALNCEAIVTEKYYSPSVINNPQKSRQFRATVEKLIGKENVLQLPPLPAGEDFALFLNTVPGVFWLLGAKCPDKMAGEHHSNNFDFDENALQIGVKLMVEGILDFLEG